MEKLKLQLANLYQSYLNLLKKGKPAGYNWVEFYSHIIYLLESGTLSDSDYTTLLEYSKAHIAVLSKSSFENTIVYATEIGLLDNDTEVDLTKEVSYWNLPLNTNETFKIKTSDVSVFGVSSLNITGRSIGSATLTISGEDVSDTQTLTVE